MLASRQSDGRAQDSAQDNRLLETLHRPSMAEYTARMHAHYCDRPMHRVWQHWLTIGNCVLLPGPYVARSTVNM